ncbi:MAG TPA: hypothetical protein PKY05_03765, partial [Fibrobacteria bacterium]|nr:hypothetical protein [Fibrobacteria bacterium]
GEGATFALSLQVENRSGQDLSDIALTTWLPAGWMPDRSARAAARLGAVQLDLRTDRIVQHFPLKDGQSRTFQVPLRAVYAGRFQGPSVEVEALYDGSLGAAWEGPRVRVVP